MKQDISEMMCLDIYLSKLPSQEVNNIKNTLHDPISKALPLLSWDIYSDQVHKSRIASTKNCELNDVVALSKRYKWKNDFDALFHEHAYDALIVTDINQKIIWLNDGFTGMTGYSKKYALHKTPRFLQGPESSPEVRKRIKQKIALNEPFSETIVNYRKDKSVYTCEVKIIPLYNNGTTHYMAFEKEIV